MDEFGDLLPNLVGPVAASSSSGSAKRRKKQALPRAFFIFGKARRYIYGAVLLSECAALSCVPGTVYWRCDRVVLLREPARLMQDDVDQRAFVPALSPETELAMRNLETNVGGTLNDHFVDMAGAS